MSTSQLDGWISPSRPITVDITLKTFVRHRRLSARLLAERGRHEAQRDGPVGATRGHLCLLLTALPNTVRCRVKRECPPRSITGLTVMSSVGLADLPVELLELIFVDLSNNDLWNLSQLCRYLLYSILPRIILRHGARWKYLADLIAQAPVSGSESDLPIQSDGGRGIVISLQKDIAPILRILRRAPPHCFSSKAFSISCKLSPPFSETLHNTCRLNDIIARVSGLRCVTINYKDFMLWEYRNRVSAEQADQLSQELKRLLTQIMNKGCQHLVLKIMSIRWEVDGSDCTEEEPATNTTINRMCISENSPFRTSSPSSPLVTPQATNSAVVDASTATVLPSSLQALAVSSGALSELALRRTILLYIHNSTSTLTRLSLQLPIVKDGDYTPQRSVLDQITLPSLISFVICDTYEMTRDALVQFLSRHLGLVRLDLGFTILRSIERKGWYGEPDFTHKLPQLKYLACRESALTYLLHGKKCFPSLKEVTIAWPYLASERDLVQSLTPIRSKLQSIPSLCIRAFYSGVRLDSGIPNPSTTEPPAPSFLRTNVTKLDLCLGVLAFPESQWNPVIMLRQWMTFTNVKVLSFYSPTMAWRFSGLEGDVDGSVDVGFDLEEELEKDRGVDPVELEKLISLAAEHWKGLDKVRIDEKIVDLEEVRKRKGLK
ncbi:hypothetical protein BDN72DRAFT_962053 [Pluteus cervinus]|uniref:Uncharacterized protein n=1 Tax=Pluteus cervinus TaxID=181527 RepID=A0ACD3AKD2_9AGAR|nr:hypothetical protein BDN72DRAFT_962053 [Pluteus cervinus]